MKLLALADVIEDKKLYEQLLLEANVANVKLPIGSDVTIKSYLDRYAEGLSTPEAKNAFVKKLSTFLINDPRYLHALRDVPPEAPDWAKQAAQTGELMLFKPDEQLNDKVQHIIHYLAACEHDVQQTANNDQKVFATGELQGFPKAQDLDLLVKKSNEYFKRGSRNQKRDSSGLEQTFDVGDGFIWYELKAPDAYAREGKVLQNCIGSNYTAATCARDHAIIFILRDPKDNTVAAARVKKEGAGYELQELKGKQNRPPVERYMKPSIAFLNKMKFSISNYANNDLSNAGYFYIEGEFYNLPDAIKNFTTIKEIAPLPSGGKVVRVTSPNPELMKRAYPGSHDAVVYEARNDANEPQFCFYVKNHSLQRVKSSKQSGEDEGYYGRQTGLDASVDPTLRNEMFTVLMNKDLLSEMEPSIRRQLFWNEKSTYNSTTKQFGKVSPDKEHQLSKEDAKWDEYNSPEVVQEIHKVLSSQGRDYGVRANDIKQVYVMHAKGDKKLVFAVTKSGAAVPGVVHNGEFTKELGTWGYTGNSYQLEGREYNDIKSLVNFANDKNLEIPKDVAKNHGIIKTKEGWKQFQASGVEVIDNPKVTKFSFDGLTPENKQIAIHYMTDEPELNQADRRYFGNRSFGNTFNAGYGDSEKLNPEKMKSVDAIYRVDITYGVDKPHRFMFTTTGNTITHLDDESKKQIWQNWDDFDKVAKIINEIKAKLRLNLSPSAATGSNEFKVVDGDLSTKSHDIKRRLEKKKLRGTASTEGVDELPYADGSKLKLMPAAQQAGWMRQGLGVQNLKGEVWYLEKPDGTIPFAYFVDNKKIIRILKHYENRYSRTRTTPLEKGKLPTDNSYNAEALKYLKAAKSTFGWKSADPKFVITNKEDDINLRDLETLVANAANPDANDGCTAISEFHKEPAYQRLIRFGLAKRVHRESTDDPDEMTHTIWLEPTAAGVAALQSVRKGENVDGLDHVAGMPIDPEFKMPEKVEPAAAPAPAAGEAAPRAERQPLANGQTKAAMAIDKFREMQAANGRIPTLGEFKRVLTAAPFNMSDLAAQTYYYSTKKRVAAPVGEGFYRLDFNIGNLSLLREVAESLRS